MFLKMCIIYAAISESINTLYSCMKYANTARGFRIIFPRMETLFFGQLLD